MQFGFPKDVKEDSGAASKGKVLTHYRRGAYFGEISLLIPNQPRQCDLIAISNVDIRELNRDDFEAICFDFPNMCSLESLKIDEMYGKGSEPLSLSLNSFEFKNKEEES